MAEFKSFEDGIEVNGQTVISLVNGMGKFQDMGNEILAKNNIFNVKPDGSYKQQDWLNAFKTIASEIGESTLFAIGKVIPENAQFPPGVDNIEKGLGIIDVAYHMNHIKNGIVMFDPSNGNMLDGIGHYKVISFENNKAVMECNTPYPSEFDRGIITCIARKFEQLAEVTVDNSKQNKKQGNETSTYIITW
jgi:hypothetical protein